MCSLTKTGSHRRRGGRAVEGTGLENRQARKGLVGSNPTPSAESLGSFVDGGSNRDDAFTVFAVPSQLTHRDRRVRACLDDRASIWSERRYAPLTDAGVAKDLKVAELDDRIGKR